MAQRVSSTPCDASGREATEAAPLLDVEKGVPEERATASPADDEAGRRFCQGFLTVVWLCMVNQMRIYYSSCDAVETRPLMAMYMVVIALSVAVVFHMVSTPQPAFAPAQSTSVVH